MPAAFRNSRQSGNNRAGGVRVRWPGGRKGVCQSRVDRIGDVTGSAPEIVICDAQHTIASAFHPMIALRVALRLGFACVLRAIDFNDELRGRTEEIDDVRPERLLSSKAKSRELLSSQDNPEPALFGCEISAKLSGAQVGKLSGAQVGRGTPPIRPPRRYATRRPPSPSRGEGH